MNNTTLELLKRRDLDKSYFQIYCITGKIYMNEGNNYVNERTIYIFFGINLEGKRIYISSALEKELEKTSDWYNFFQEMKKRKIEKIIFGLLPENKNMRDAIKLSYPKIELFDSCDKTIDKLKRYNSYKTKDEIYREVRKLYIAKDELEFEINYEGFMEKYKNYPFIMELLEENIKKLKKNYKYSYIVRRVIYSFNYTTELGKRLEELANEEVYVNKEEFLKKLVWYIHNSEKMMPFTKLEWINVLNDIYIEKKEMIQPYL